MTVEITKSKAKIKAIATQIVFLMEFISNPPGAAAVSPNKAQKRRRKKKAPARFTGPARLKNSADNLAGYHYFSGLFRLFLFKLLGQKEDYYW